LPSEAQWEYACRAGTQTPYSFGTTVTTKQVCYDSYGPVVVGSLSANGWGLHEMHGNVWEWCEDHWHDTYDGAPIDGSAWIDTDRGAALRVVGGGSWRNDARSVRAANRGGHDPAYRLAILGFRCAHQSDSAMERRAGRSKPSERNEQAATTSPQRQR
jgi:formylglycine-generating enzyme required for sulfatase activity